jgi:hypothetical protein
MRRRITDQLRVIAPKSFRMQRLHSMCITGSAQAILAEEPFRLILAPPLSGWMLTYPTEPMSSPAM